MTKREKLARRLCGVMHKGANMYHSTWPEESVWAHISGDEKAGWRALADEVMQALTLPLKYAAEDVENAEYADYMYAHIDDAKQYKAACERLLGEGE